jgi:hypothetical protein
VLGTVLSDGYTKVTKTDKTRAAKLVQVVEQAQGPEFKLWYCQNHKIFSIMKPEYF